MSTYRATVELAATVVAREAGQFTGDPAEFQRQQEVYLLAEQAISEQYRRSPSKRWISFYGYYCDDFPDDAANAFDSPLMGNYEGVWDRQITRLLQQNKDVRPTVFLDFGGGLGLSLIRAGKQYAEAVERGDLILAATNLGYDPTALQYEGYTGVAAELKRLPSDRSWSEAELDFVQEHQSRVQFLDANVLELPNTTVQSSDGRPVPLLGNTSGISESSALRHSNVPGVALGVFSQLLVTGGNLNIDAKKSNYVNAPSWSSLTLPDGRVIEGRPIEMRDWRGLSLEAGHAALRYQLDMEIVADHIYGPLEYIKR